MVGRKNIFVRLIYWVKGEEIFVISVPLSLNIEIVGTIQKLLFYPR